VERGAAVFAERGCTDCHTGAAATNRGRSDVGTGGDSPDGAFDVPSLRWLWLSAPYFHDGRAQTLLDVFTLPGTHQLIYNVPMEDIHALTAYLMTLPTP
jgi:cytochrome c peroxidase